MSRIISIQEAEVLLEKYYDGLTGKEEERLLHDFLAREDVPERFHAEKAMFGYFDKQKKAQMMLSKIFRYFFRILEKLMSE